MSEETKQPQEGESGYHPAMGRLSKKKPHDSKRSNLRFIVTALAVVIVLTGWLYLVYRPQPVAPIALTLTNINQIGVGMPAPIEVLEDPELQAAMDLMKRQEEEIEKIALRFIEVEDFRWKKVGWKVEKIRDIDSGIALGKDVEAFSDVKGRIIETRVTDDDIYGLWGIGIQYARLIGLDEDDPDWEDKIALIAAYVNNDFLTIEYEKYANKEFNPHLIPPGTLVRFRPLDDSKLEILFTDWRLIIDRQS